MSRAPKLSLNSMLAKIALVLAIAVGAVSGTLTYFEGRSAANLTRDFVANLALEQTTLISEIVAGAVKFRKADQITASLDQAMKQSRGQLVAAIAIGADGEIVAEVEAAAEAGTEHRAAALTLARQALETDETATAMDGLLVAIPLHFGANGDIVGAIVNAWTPEKLREQFRAEGRVAMIIAGVVFAISVLACLFLFRQIVIVPLNRSRAVIQALTEGNYEVDIPQARRRDEIGSIGRSLVTLRDTLTEAAEAQRESTFKGAAFTAASSAQMITDEDLTITYVNPKMVELMRALKDTVRETIRDFDAEKLVGQPIEIFHGPGRFPGSKQEIRRALQSRKGAPFVTTLRFGEARIALTVSSVVGDAGKPLGHVLEWKDVTQDWLNRAVIEAIEANQIKAEFDLGGDFLTANPRAREALGIGERDARGMAFHEMLPGGAGDRTAKTLLQDVVGGEAYIGKTTLRTRGAEELVLDGSITCVRNPKGEPIRVLLLGNDVTLQEKELSESRAQRQVAEHQQNEVVDALRVGLRKLSGGDLTASIEKPFAGSYEELRVDYNGTVANLAKALRDIAENAENIHNEARDISTTADGLSRRTESTAATLEETAAALDDLTTSVRAAASGAARADEAVTAAKGNAEDSGRVVLDTVAAMDQIAESSDRITSIIKVIDDIAFQTNLLALNAGVEAARAGDAGRGFAVVASEVRALAQRSSDAAREINELIAKSGSQVKTGVDLVGRTGNALRQIVDSVTEISTLVSDIATSSKQQSASLAEINKAVTQLDQSTQQNAARLEETTAASDALRNDAVSLVETVSHFKMSEETSENGGVVQQGHSKRQAPTKPKMDTRSSPVAGAGVSMAARALKPIEKAAAEWEDF